MKLYLHDSIRLQDLTISVAFIVAKIAKFKITLFISVGSRFRVSEFYLAAIIYETERQTDTKAYTTPSIWLYALFA
jgi:hypothetical protein